MTGVGYRLFPGYIRVGGALGQLRTYQLKFERRRIVSTRFSGSYLLAAIRNGGHINFFFKSGVTALATFFCSGFRPIEVWSIGGGARVVGDFEGNAASADLILASETQTVPILMQEQTLFAGRNAAIVIRNGEAGATVAEWLTYHAATHDLEGAVILDLSGPSEDLEFAAELQSCLRDALDVVVVLSCDVAMGKKDFGPEAHPMNAPDAPGKVKMTAPSADPWRAPFGEPIFFELIRHWFLDRARAVLSLEAHDLLSSPEGETVFDIAYESDTGLVAMLGRRIYPWSIRKGRVATFGDHICRRFDGSESNPRWCVAPTKTAKNTIWRHTRVVGAHPSGKLYYDRCMAIRHAGSKVSEIVPKASLVEDPQLVHRASELFAAKPMRAPKLALSRGTGEGPRISIVTTMKNEGPFILEWLAYHRAIGVDGFLVYTNDCTDGTDDMLDLLQLHGLLQHRENPFRGAGLKPQHAALQAAHSEPMIQSSDWVVCMDVDEFMAIHTGAGKIDDLFAALGDANLISMTWRLFGNSDISEYVDALIIQQFTRCAPELIRKPHQAWGFKTLFRNVGLFKKLGVHRPKGLNPQLVDDVRWVNGSGRPLPKAMYRNAWRSTVDSYGYDLVTLNHYAVRSTESFLVKRDRGRVNHVDRDQGFAYWFRMNNNAEEDRSIQRMIPEVQEELARLKSLEGVAEAHATSVARHRVKIEELRAREDYASFYAALNSDRFRTLSRIHHIFGRDTFLAGPEVIPDEIIRLDHPPGFFFSPS